VAQRKPFLLRIDPRLMVALRRWADDELRSVNAQIEYLLRRALVEAGRVQPRAADGAPKKPDVKRENDG